MGTGEGLSGLNRTGMSNWIDRRKLRSRRKFLKSNFRQYGQMKSREASQKRKSEKSREEKSKSEKVRRKKMQVREKVGSRETLCFSTVVWLRRVEKKAC